MKKLRIILQYPVKIASGNRYMPYCSYDFIGIFWILINQFFVKIQQEQRRPFETLVRSTHAHKILRLATLNAHQLPRALRML